MQWSPAPLRMAGVAVCAAFLGVAAVGVIADLPGKLLVGGVAVGLLLDVVHDVVARPRLAATPGGVVARRWSGRQELPWRGLRVRVRTTKRLGFLTRTLELDTQPECDEDGVLVVLGRRDVGAPLDDVAEALRALNPIGGAGTRDGTLPA